MASITIRNLDEGIKQKLRVLAARNGRSMEAEVREILARAVEEGSETKGGAPFDRVRGIWSGRGRTDDLLAITRGRA